MNPKVRLLYTAVMLSACLFFAYMLTAKDWLQTDLATLLPQEQQDAVLQAADKAGEKQLNSQVILLSGSDDAQQAFQTAADIADLWQKSAVFASVDSNITPDLGQLRNDMALLGLAVLPHQQRAQLFDNPQTYFQERAEAAVNPFAAHSPLALEQDWLGFGRFVGTQANPQSRLQWSADNGMLFTEDENGKTWVWLRGRLPSSDAFPHERLLQLMSDSRRLAHANQTDVLTAGGALFAAAAKTEAERESQMMSVCGMVLTFALLLWTFRSGRVFWLAAPLAAGVLCGLAATLALFGEVHILTLLIGTSLVGMLVDFPLHWLAPSVFKSSEKEEWQALSAIRQVLPSFTVSMLITILGYALLWFTPLPVLRQTAVFSGFALLGAFGATVLWLPFFFKNYQPKAVPFAAFTIAFTTAFRPQSNRLKKGRDPLLLVAFAFIAVGVWRSDWRDDIREWVNMPSDMLVEVQQIGILSGTDFSGRYLVAEAPSEDKLLHKNAEIALALQPLIAQGKLGGTQTLAQFISPTDEQDALKKRLKTLAAQPQTWHVMTEIGVPEATFRNALLQAADTPSITLSDGLKPQLAEAWQSLYLGEVGHGRFASIIRLNGMSDSGAVRAAVHNIQGVHWADKRGFLNESFLHTRNQAAWLKLASYALALLLLWKMFGLKRGVKILTVPLVAALGTIAVLGWLQIPISLFAMFGLLLVSAIGVDYSVYALTAKHSTAARLGGMLLAALTTGISFVLLTSSSTPAVSAFGITVAVGVVFNLLLSVQLLHHNEHHQPLFLKD